jgi:hypothetical protein
MTRERKAFTAEERMLLEADLEKRAIAKQTLTYKALARKHGRSPRAIETYDFHRRHANERVIIKSK